MKRYQKHNQQDIEEEKQDGYILMANINLIFHQVLSVN